MMIHIDEDRRLVTVDSNELKLGKSEILIIKHLISSKKRIAKEELMKVGWPNKVVSPNSVQVAIANIRKQLPKNSIITSDGGYLFDIKIDNKKSLMDGHDSIEDNKKFTNPLSRMFFSIIATGIPLLIPTMALAFNLYSSNQIELYKSNINDNVFSSDKDLLRNLFGESDVNISTLLSSKENRDKTIFISKLNSSYVIQCINNNVTKSIVINNAKEYLNPYIKDGACEE
ncbi:winged helix-turn-helix domain-containing protein [Shewanella waksmanii]|uniref:winged helix-turn-helix domain-containing protein n=1 Tax=Shewanella waksmanii TaxID=213783 RepID=UPI00048EEEA1|nr:winged helix-turn-helix domain-containing protein [Shewanella waksmanii]